MAGVFTKFFVASMFMWMAPVAILHAFNNGLLPGLADMSPHSVTLLSSFLAVISVNIVIAFYICMALKEPSDKHKPDLKFLAEAKDTLKKKKVSVQFSAASATFMLLSQSTYSYVRIAIRFLS